ncbi:MAG: hypothetical protein ABSB35_05740 [Bryobacteraceae bacterium]|jgi:hypothetical protein
MSLFIERYLLPITAALTVLLITTNPMKFDWTQRITGGLALVLASYFFAHTVQLKNRVAPAEPIESGVPAAAPQVHQSGPATTLGDNSPANTGDGNTFNGGSVPAKKDGEKK